MCTSNQFWGCSRQGSPEHIVNPIQSARLRSDKSFNFKYGKMEVRAKMPKGDWIWPGSCFHLSVLQIFIFGWGVQNLEFSKNKVFKNYDCDSLFVIMNII